MIQKHRKFVIGENGIAWKVISVAEKGYSRMKRGTIERHLKDENFERIFVFTEQEAKNELFL